MRTLTFVLLLAALVQVEPQFLSQLANAALAVITKSFSDSNELGEYSYGVETSDGLSRGETRKVFNPGTAQETAVVEGYYSYIGADGERYTVGYKADEDGFQPEGEHLPPAASVKRRPPQVGIGQDPLKTLQGTPVG